MDDVQNCDSYINIPSSQTYRSYLPKMTETFHIVSRIEVAITLLIRELPSVYTPLKPISSLKWEKWEISNWNVKYAKARNAKADIDLNF
jgi:hypothetical protein